MKLQKIDYSELENQYLYTQSTKEDFNDYYKYKSDDYIDEVKKVIIDKLDIVDRQVILLYIHMGNMRAVASTLDVSLGTAYKKIKKIQNKIYDILQNNTNNHIHNIHN